MQLAWGIVRGHRVAKVAQPPQSGKCLCKYNQNDINSNPYFIQTNVIFLHRCHQLLVNYSKIPFTEWQKNAPDLEKFEWDVADTRLLINSEGCGYPPHVNCTEFAKKYGWVIDDGLFEGNSKNSHLRKMIIYEWQMTNALLMTLVILLLYFCRYSHVGEQFPCFYSRAYPEMVITRYSWEDNLKHLILSLIIPNVIFAISIGVLSYWYCPCCDKACRKSTRVYVAEKYPNKEE